jgi:lambda family phage tail tape measure protein
VLADLTERMFLAKTETGSFSNELLAITQNRQQVLEFLEAVASGLAFIAEAAVLTKRVITQPFDSLQVVGKDLETWFKVDSLGTMKAMGYDPKLIDAEILKLQAARDKFVEAANQRLANINQNPGYVDQVQRFFDEQRRTVRVMGQKFVLDTAEQAAQVQKIYDEFLPKQPRKKPLALDLSGFQSKGSTEKRDEGDAFLRQLQGRVTKNTEGEAAELRAKALDLEAKGYKGVAAQAEKYITVLDAIEKQKEANKRFDEYEKEEQKSRQIVENFIGANRQRADELQLKRQMLDLSEADRVALQTRADLEKSASAARKEANQLQEPDLARQAIEAINDALARQLPIVEDLARANVDYQRSFEYGTKSALRTYIEDATNAAKQAERAVTGAFRTMEDALTRFVTNGKLDFKSMADSIITDLVRIQIQRMITLPLANWASGLFSGGGSDASALPAGATDLMSGPVMVAHSGGLVGAETLSSRSAPIGLFAGAPRFHGGGLVAGEVPIIARQGEAVFTPGQLRALGGAVGSKSEVLVEVNVINRASGVEARVERQQQPDGGMRLDVIVEQMEARMSRSISQGSGLAPTLERRYGLNPAAGSFR